MSPADSAICDAMGEILETMYFCEPEYMGRGQFNGPAIGARLAFSGDLSGEFRVIVAESAALRLTADFLGAGPQEITSGEARLAVRELANVACGAAMNTWMPDATLDFSVPDELPAAELAGEWAHGFSLSDGALELGIEIRIRDAA